LGGFQQFTAKKNFYVAWDKATKNVDARDLYEASRFLATLVIKLYSAFLSRTT